MNEKYLEKLHYEILNIMDEIDRICKKCSLKYYLIGGTLLGAIRHEGFIPWDDDMDIIMPRKDFEKFVLISEKELKSPFKLAWITTNEEYRHLYAKVENSDTVFYEDVTYKTGMPGIFVDVFPLDSTEGYSPSVIRRKRIVKKLATMMGMKISPEKHGIIKDFILNHISTKKINQVATHIMTASTKRECHWYTNFGSQYSAKKQTMPVEYYGEGKEASFEDRNYIIPDKAENVLISIFGENYMQLPPIEKRRTHVPEYVKFSDGTEMFFNRLSSKAIDKSEFGGD